MNTNKQSLPSGSMAEVEKPHISPQKKHPKIGALLDELAEHLQKANKKTIAEEANIKPVPSPQTHAEKETALIDEMRSIIKEMEEKSAQRLADIKKRREVGGQNAPN